MRRRSRERWSTSARPQKQILRPFRLGSWQYLNESRDREEVNDKEISDMKIYVKLKEECIQKTYTNDLILLMTSKLYLNLLYGHCTRSTGLTVWILTVFLVLPVS